MMSVYSFAISLLGTYEFYIAIGLFLTVYQLKQFEKREKTAHENELNKEYRSIVSSIPVDALLGNEVEEWQGKSNDQSRLDSIYPYIDLSNQQVFLRKRGRITKSRWKDWEEGIKAHLSQKEFQMAWERIKEETEGPSGRSFEELRCLESPPQEFDTDPYYWGLSWWRIPMRKIWELLPVL